MRQKNVRAKHNTDSFMNRRFGDLLRAKGIPFVIEITSGSLNTASIGEVICHTTEKLGASAVVMSPHGKGRLTVRLCRGHQTFVPTYLIYNVTWLAYCV